MFSQSFLEVLFQDEDILVIDKPPNLTTTEGETVKGETVAGILQRDFGITLERGGVVHRLDKDTSGVLVVAKTAKALENLQTQFKNRAVKKEYLTLVHGWVEEKGKVEAAIFRNPVKREKFAVISGEQGKKAVTEYEPLQKLTIPDLRLPIIFADLNKLQLRKLHKTNYGRFTLLKVKPLTGRTHQIRVHLKYAGFPVAGDSKYAGRKMARLDRRFIGRQFLHAQSLEFNHPKTGERMRFESPLPLDLEEVLNRLESL